MRRGRFLAPGAVEGDRGGIYHCVSRVVDRRFVLKKAEKEQFVSFMRLYEDFCGVRVLAFCIMSNHFHLLLEVPPRPVGEQELPDREFFRRLRLLYSEAHVLGVRELIRKAKKLRDPSSAVAEVKEKYLYRMWDLSEFMKTLKQRFTQWFNKRRGKGVRTNILILRCRFGIIENEEWHGNDGSSMRKAPGRAGDRLPDGQSLQSTFRRGWYFGSEAFRENLLKLLGKDGLDLGADRQKGYNGPQTRDHGKAEARRIIGLAEEEFGLRGSDWAGLKKGD